MALEISTLIRQPVQPSKQSGECRVAGRAVKRRRGVGDASLAARLSANEKGGAAVPNCFGPVMPLPINNADAPGGRALGARSKSSAMAVGKIARARGQSLKFYGQHEFHAGY